jgi:excisionase family DNA binding protein
MEVITIENKAFQEIILKLDQLHEFFRSFSQKYEDEEEKNDWIDSKAVCERMNISTRTLYRLRKERIIGYSIVRGQYRFRKSDVEKILNERHVVSNPKTLDELRQPLQINNYGKPRI